MNEMNLQKQTATPLEKAVLAAGLAADKKGYDIRLIDISRVSTITDYLLIISGQTERQNQAICENIRKELKKFGKVTDIEGESDGKWIVMDYMDLLVHIFQQEQRLRYDLDSLWENGELIELPEELQLTDRANKADLARL